MDCSEDLVARKFFQPWWLRRLVTSPQAVVVHDKYLEDVSNLIMNIGRRAPRYQNMALLYPSSRNLQSHLLEYFIVVVRLCNRLLTLTKQPTLAKVASIFSGSDLKNFQSELDRWANEIREDVELLMGNDIQELPNIKALLSSDSKSAIRRRKLKKKLRVLDACSKYDFETSWRQVRKTGTTRLFHQYDEYRHWINRTDSCTLILTGKLGAGKSVLLANVVDDLHVSVQEKSIAIAYFFCRHDVGESLEARTIMGSIVRQLLDPFSDLGSASDFLDKQMFDSDLDGLFNLLSRTLQPDHKAYIILDGLDECNMGERSLLIEQLCKLQEFITLHLCVSLRLEPASVGTLTSDLQQFVSVAVISLPDNNPEIESFIELELERRLKSGKLILGDPTLIIEICEALVRGSQGMFLWATLQLETICAMSTDESIRYALYNLPKDLSETFSRVLQKSENCELGQGYKKRLIELLVTVFRPLHIEELREALSVVVGDTMWRPDRLLNHVMPILAAYGGLIVVEEEELTVHLVHHSFKQFLLSEFRGATNYGFSVDHAAKTTSDVIITYLNYDIFGTEVATAVVPQIDVGTAPSRIIQSTQASSKARTVALRILQSKKQLHFDASKVVAEARNLSNARVLDFSRFHGYAKRYCLDHVFRIRRLDATEYRLFVRLFEKSLIDMHVAHENSQELLLLAVKNKCQTVVNAMLDTGRIDGASLLRNENNGELVKLLLNSGKIDVNARDEQGHTPLSDAAWKNNKETLRLLLDSDHVDANLSDHKDNTPLTRAIIGRHQEVVKLLLNSGKVDVNLRTVLAGRRCQAR